MADPVSDPNPDPIPDPAPAKAPKDDGFFAKIKKGVKESLAEIDAEKAKDKTEPPMKTVDPMPAEPTPDDPYSWEWEA